MSQPIRVTTIALLAGAILAACGAEQTDTSADIARETGAETGAESGAIEVASNTAVDEPRNAPVSEPDPTQPPASASSAELLAFFAELPGDPLPENCEVHETGSGLRYAVLKAGEGGAPCFGNDSFKAAYVGYFEDGRIFDRNSSLSLPVGGVIAGWTEALKLMTRGQKLKIWIPWKLAYGERGRSAIPGKSNLVFDMDLLEIIRAPKPLPLPDFFMPGESELTTTASGLQYTVIEEGEGNSPKATDKVTMHYAGWLTDGTSFDDSFKTGKPLTYPLNEFIPGWTEGVQLMKPGAVYVFVIPHELAYGVAGSPPKIPPSATLVFRVELLEIGG